MTKMYIYIAVLLTIAWIIVGESTHWMIISSGVLVSLICIISMKKLLPLAPIKDICLIRLTLYPLFILGPIFSDAFYVFKTIFKNAKTEELTVTTEIKHPFLRVLLANSIAITPGSLPVSLKEESLHCIWIRAVDEPVKDLKDPADALKGSLERYIKKMEK